MTQRSKYLSAVLFSSFLLVIMAGVRSADAQSHQNPAPGVVALQTTTTISAEPTSSAATTAMATQDLSTTPTLEFGSTLQVSAEPSSKDTIPEPSPTMPSPTSTPEAVQTSGEQPIQALQSSEQLLSDGQFVWGPNVGDFDTLEFLGEQDSPLAPFAAFIEGTARYAGINPRVFLATLETRYGLVSGGAGSRSKAEVYALIEELSLELHQAFYEHLYTLGARRGKTTLEAPPQASLSIEGNLTMQVDEGVSSGSYAIAVALAPSLAQESGMDLVAADAAGGFSAIFADFFPESDPLDDSNNINPDTTLPNDFFQFPFPLNAAWRFSGAHSWGGGGGYPDRSSMDFMTTWSNFPNFPYKNSVAAAGGNAWVVPPSKSDLPCWVEIDHGGGWKTSYYHLINLGDSAGTTGSINQNQLIGAIGEETCNGGWAEGEHVHFTLWYNGALADLDGINLSGWTIHEGPRDGSSPYSTGYIERDGVIKTPYNTVLNDYHTYFGSDMDYSLRFFGNTSADIDRIEVPMTDFDPGDFTGPPTDVGHSDFAVEWWLRANPGANNSAPITCGANENWKVGNLLLDRSRGNHRQQWGVSLVDGKIAFGVSNSSNQHYTLCSQSQIDDGEWHHVLIQRNRYDNSQGLYYDGQIWIFIDGDLEATAVGPIGNISYPDSSTPGSNCGVSGTQNCSEDPYLVIGASKYNTSGAFNGWIDDLRFSWWLRSLEDFTPPAQPLTPDEDTVALFDFNEGSGIVINDTGGYDGGASTGTIHYGGSPAGPVWTTIIPHFEDQYIYLPLIMR